MRRRRKGGGEFMPPRQRKPRSRHRDPHEDPNSTTAFDTKGGPSSTASGGGASARPPRRSATRKGASKRRPRAFRRYLWATVALFAVAVLVAVLGCVACGLLPGPGKGRLVEVDLAENTSVATVARQLDESGVVGSALAFRIYAALNGGSDSIRSGVHLLADDMSLRTLWRRLRRTPVGATVRVVIPEGFNKFEIARRLHERGVCAARAFLASTVDPALLRELRLPANDAEGYLFAASYDMVRNVEPRDVVRRMVGEAERRYARLFDQHSAGLDEIKSTLGWDKHQVIILASIVEKEAAVDDERAIIAGVFLNRLRDPNVKAERRKLQSDPTARYGCLLQRIDSCETAEGKTTPAMVHDPMNPYSTYAHPGLTPGPISNPSEKSLQAVLAPVQTHYFYFVAKGNGRHIFSETYDEHSAAVRDRAK